MLARLAGRYSPPPAYVPCFTPVRNLSTDLWKSWRSQMTLHHISIWAVSEHLGLMKTRCGSLPRLLRSLEWGRRYRLFRGRQSFRTKWIIKQTPITLFVQQGSMCSLLRIRLTVHNWTVHWHYFRRMCVTSLKCHLTTVFLLQTNHVGVQVHECNGTPDIATSNSFLTRTNGCSRLSCLLRSHSYQKLVLGK